MHPVVVGGEFTVDLAVLGPLPGDAVPDAACFGQQPIVAPQHIQQGQLHEAFVGVVTAIHARPIIAPVQGAVGAHIAVDKLAGGVVELGDEGALLQGPGGRCHGGVDANGWHEKSFAHNSG